MGANDPVLGFFHGWIGEFAKHFEHINVVCLREGAHLLPNNVRIYSLGKESGASRLKYVARFLSFAWRLRGEYDAVLVHMNQEYILLGSVLWKLLGKKIYLWRNHYAGGLATNLAAALCDKIFCTSKFSYTAKFKKTVLMPVGIDMSIFKPLSVERVPRSILFFSRFAPSKPPEVWSKALKILKPPGTQFKASFYGSAGPQDMAYRKDVVEKAQALGDSALFFEGVSNTEAPRIYSAHEIFVDLSASGMYNKTIFEAAACGCLVFASSRDFAELVDPRFVFTENDERDLSGKIKTLLSLSESERNILQTTFTTIAQTHSLEALGTKLVKEVR